MAKTQKMHTLHQESSRRLKNKLPTAKMTKRIPKRELHVLRPGQQPRIPQKKLRRTQILPLPNVPEEPTQKRRNDVKMLRQRQPRLVRNLMHRLKLRRHV